jgi:hypothetical protein
MPVLNSAIGPASGEAESSRLNRLAIAVLLAVGSGFYFVHLSHIRRDFFTDFDQLWAAARFLLQGRNPYPAIGPGREFAWRWQLYYPLPAVLLAVPFALLPLPVARLLFTTFGAALFLYAFGAQSGGRWKYIVVLSRSFDSALGLAQASFILASMYMLPSLGALAVAKPNMGAAVVGATLNTRAARNALFGAAVLIGVGLIIFPTWIYDWLVAISTNRFRIPAVLRPGGFLLLAAATKWRRPEARLLLFLAIVPQTLGMYDALLLFLIPRRPVEFIALTVLSHAAYFVSKYSAGADTLDAYIVVFGTIITYFMFLPCLLMVIRRPNVGMVPAWLEGASARVPRWLRGHAVANG